MLPGRTHERCAFLVAASRARAVPDEPGVLRVSLHMAVSVSVLVGSTCAYLTLHTCSAH